MGDLSSCRQRPVVAAARERSYEQSSEEQAAIERDFVRYHQTRDRELRNALVTRHRWLAEQCARRFRDRGEPWADLVQVAEIGVVKAVERFDPARGVSFMSFAVPTVTGELKRYFRDSTWAVHVPRRAKDLLARMNVASDLLHQRLGRSPTVDELAAELCEDRDTVLDTIEANRVYRSESLSRPAGGDGDREPAGVVGGDDADLDAVATKLTAHRALGALDPRSRTIVYWRFFEECTQQEIGDRLGIGQVQVSRLLRAALSRLRTQIEALEGAEL